MKLLKKEKIFYILIKTKVNIQKVRLMTVRLVNRNQGQDHLSLGKLNPLLNLELNKKNKQLKI